MSAGLLFDDLYREPIAQPDLRRQQEAAAREGERRKREGREQATWNKEHLLAHARELALDIARGLVAHADGSCRVDGLCTADDVAAAWEREQDEKAAKNKYHVRVPWLGNAAGSIFTGGNWYSVGMVKSARPHAHSNLLKQWRLKHRAPGEE